MIFLLDIILFANLILAYQKFRYVIAPPILMGSGMFVASFVATIYYEEWRMEEMLLESVLIIGGGTLFFTIVCIFFRRVKPRIVEKITFTLDKIDDGKILSFLFVLILLGIIVSLMKLMAYASFFGGGLGFSNLIESAREDLLNGGRKFEFPFYLRWLSNFVSLSSCITTWILSVYLFAKKTNKYIVKISILQLFLLIIDGLVSGAKGGAFDTMARFGVVYTFFLYAKTGTYHLSKSTVKKALIAFVIVLLSFKGMNLVMGRDVDSLKPADLFAAYVGAEIKNFDIYLHGDDGNDDNMFYGQQTFLTYYTKKYPQKMKYEDGKFLFVGDSFLGNVYTQYYHYHKDFGTLGVFVMLAIIAFTSMFMYNRALDTFKNPLEINCWLLIYSMTAFHLFMSFFSARYTIGLFHWGFVTNMIFVWLVSKWFATFIKKNAKVKIHQ